MCSSVAALHFTSTGSGSYCCAARHGKASRFQCGRGEGQPRGVRVAAGGRRRHHQEGGKQSLDQVNRRVSAGTSTPPTLWGLTSVGMDFHLARAARGSETTAAIAAHVHTNFNSLTARHA